MLAADAKQVVGVSDNRLCVWSPYESEREWLTVNGFVSDNRLCVWSPYRAALAAEADGIKCRITAFAFGRPTDRQGVDWQGSRVSDNRLCVWSPYRRPRNLLAHWKLRGGWRAPRLIASAASIELSGTERITSYSIRV